MNNLFNKQLFNKYLNDIEISQNQLDHLTLWNQKLHNGELIAETSNYHHFENIFLNKLLGYDSLTDILADDKEISGSGKSEFKLKRGNEVFMIIELKGSNINLDKSRNNKNETPVDQVFRYAKKNEAVPWLLLSNYDEFRLYNYHKGDGKYISWTIKELVNDENKLKEFMFVLGKQSFENRIIDNLIDKTIIIQEDFNDEFYKLYSETRLMLIHDLEETSEDIDRLKAIHYAQLIMDRVIFICFAEDKELLPEQILEDTILTPIRNNNVRKHRIFDRLRELFEDIHEGNPGKEVSEYNGGLFKERLWFLDIQDTIENPNKYYENCFSEWKFESQKNETEELLGEYKDTLNPIYKNFITMSIFNFDSDVDVNILGHIFETSISDIEKLKEDNSETRHKFGIHYTPPEITDYICRNTIIPHLSKTGKVNEIPELLSEYITEIDILDEKLKNIKILDPACGSGAFLNKAVDILLEIHEAIYHEKYDEKQTLDYLWDDETVRRDIIINNIYGVDLNEESTEITKLGLFLKICKKDKKLPSLDDNIKCGNSVISSEECIGNKAFKWEEEYENILNEGGFDVIIGNPPYVRVQEIDPIEIDYYTKNYKFAMGHIDLSILFTELAYTLIKKAGKIGFITSNMFLTTNYGENIRKYLSKSNEIRIDKIIDFGDLKVFKDAMTYVSIFIFTKTSKNNFEYHFVKSLDENLFNIKFTEIEINHLDKDAWILKEYSLRHIFKKINENPKLNEGFGTANTGCFSGLDKLLLFDNLENIPVEKECLMPILSAADVKKYLISTATEYIIYPYELVNNETRILELEEIEKKFPKLFSYLNNHKEELGERKDSRKKLSENPHWYKLIRQGNLNTFKQEKIVTKGESKTNQFGIDIGNSFKNARIFAVLPDETVDINFLLGILNSKLIETFLHSISSLKSGGYYTYNSKVLNKVPIPVKNLNNNELINMVIKIRNKTKNLDKEIQTFIKWLEIEYEIKISKNLKKYYELSFENFINELKKKNVKITKNVFSDLEKEFKNSLDIILPLQKEIKELNMKINQNVYELYGLTRDEIQIIEEIK